MSGLLVVGAGGHGKVVAEAALSMDSWEKIAFLDDLFPKIKEVLRLPVVGSVDDASLLREEYPNIVVAIGDNATRLHLLERFSGEGFRLSFIKHARSEVSPTAKVGAGVVIFAQVAVNAETRISDGVIINTGATVDHNCILGEGAHVSPGAHLAGNVDVGRNSWIGIGASIVPGIRIGSNVIVGAGSVVLDDIPDNSVAVGVPAKVIKSR